MSLLDKIRDDWKKIIKKLFFCFIGTFFYILSYKSVSYTYKAFFEILASIFLILLTDAIKIKKEELTLFIYLTLIYCPIIGIYSFTRILKDFFISLGGAKIDNIPFMKIISFFFNILFFLAYRPITKRFSIKVLPIGGTIIFGLVSIFFGFFQKLSIPINTKIMGLSTICQNFSATIFYLVVDCYGGLALGSLFFGSAQSVIKGLKIDDKKLEKDFCDRLFRSLGVLAQIFMFFSAYLNFILSEIKKRKLANLILQEEKTEFLFKFTKRILVIIGLISFITGLFYYLLFKNFRIEEVEKEEKKKLSLKETLVSIFNIENIKVILIGITLFFYAFIIGCLENSLKKNGSSDLEKNLAFYQINQSRIALFAAIIISLLKKYTSNFLISNITPLAMLLSSLVSYIYPFYQNSYIFNNFYSSLIALSKAMKYIAFDLSLANILNGSDRNEREKVASLNPTFNKMGKLFPSILFLVFEKNFLFISLMLSFLIISFWIYINVIINKEKIESK